MSTTPQTVLEGIASIIAGEFNTTNSNLANVKATADGALQATDASNTYATKQSLGDYSLTTDIASTYASLAHVTNNFIDNQELATELALYYTKVASDARYVNISALSDYYTKNEVDTKLNKKVNTADLDTRIQNTTLTSVNATNITGGAMDLTGDVTIGGNLQVNGADTNVQSLNVTGAIASATANVGSVTQPNAQALNVTGNTNVDGKLVVKNLEVSGTTTVVNTTSVSVKDDFIELNRAEDGATTSTKAGIKINNGKTLVVDGSGNPILDAQQQQQYTDNPDSSLEYNTATGQWKATTNGTNLADMFVGKSYFNNKFADFASLPSATTYPGMLVVTEDTAQLWFSCGGSWFEVAQQAQVPQLDSLGTLAEFNATFLNTLDSDGDGTPNAQEDSDGDGVVDGTDTSPYDPLVTGVDADNDLLDDAVDPDPTNPDFDNDNVIDGLDQDPTNPFITGNDLDRDGIDDSIDTDKNDPTVSGQDADNDGIDDAIDVDPTTDNTTALAQSTSGFNTTANFTSSGSLIINTTGHDNWYGSYTYGNYTVTVTPIANASTTGIIRITNNGTNGQDAIGTISNAGLEMINGWSITPQVTAGAVTRITLGFDEDSDDDGIADINDSQAFNAQISGVDADSDNVDDAVDTDPNDPNVTGIDADQDNIDDAVDTDPTDPNVTGVDDDNDGVDDAVDPDPSNPNITGVDLDQDNIDDAIDSDPNDPNVSGIDADQDGLDDNVDPDSTNPDTDNDGVLDGTDTHPSDATLSGVDADNDNVDDAVDSDPNNPNVSGIDEDQDGVDDAVDTDPSDPDISGVDDDQDGIDDAVDSDPNDAQSSGIDIDNDGLDDAIDPDTTKRDTDDDGVLDGYDSHPSDSTLSGVDADNDNVDDAVDTHLNNPTLGADSDLDGIDDKIDILPNFDQVTGNMTFRDYWTSTGAPADFNFGYWPTSSTVDQSYVGVFESGDSTQFYFTRNNNLLDLYPKFRADPSNPDVPASPYQDNLGHKDIQFRYGYDLLISNGGGIYYLFFDNLGASRQGDDIIANGRYRIRLGAQKMFVNNVFEIRPIGYFDAFRGFLMAPGVTMSVNQMNSNDVCHKLNLQLNFNADGDSRLDPGHGVTDPDLGPFDPTL